MGALDQSERPADRVQGPGGQSQPWDKAAVTFYRALVCGVLFGNPERGMGSLAQYGYTLPQSGSRQRKGQSTRITRAGRSCARFHPNTKK